MRNLIKGAALALAAAMVLSSVQLAVFAEDTGLPSAVVTELTGADLNASDVNAILPDFSIDAEELTGLTETAYTMNKAVMFSTNYERDAKGELTKAGKAAQDADLEKYGDWICDFRININTPDDAIKGDEIILIGNYGGWGNIGFVTSKLAEMAGVSEVRDGDYYLMQVMAEAMNKPRMANETYKEVAEGVINFKCGIVDNDLPMESVVTVQLVMYEDRDRTKVHEIGAPVIYEKHAKPGAPETELVQVGLLDSEVKEVAATGDTGVEVTGIKDSMIATEKTKLINDYIVEENVEKPAEGTATVNVDIFAKTEQLTPEATKFELTPYAQISTEGKPTKEVEITNDQLKEDAKVTVVVPAERQPRFIIHRSEGMEPEKYLPGDHLENDKEFTYSQSEQSCTFFVSHFSEVEFVYDYVAITDKDAYVDNDGYGNLRFISKSYANTGDVAKFGTWIVADDIFAEGTGELYTNSEDELKLDSELTADLMKIPSDWVNHVFYAKSYVNIAGTDEWSPVESASVEDYKNSTSK